MASTKEATNSKKPTAEMITPHKLTLTILIRNYCRYREDGKLI